MLVKAGFGLEVMNRPFEEVLFYVTEILANREDDLGRSYAGTGQNFYYVNNENE